MTTSEYTHRPECAYRGDRTYIHSTDIYEEVAKAVFAAKMDFEGPIELRLKSKIQFCPKFVVRELASESSGVQARCTFFSGGIERIVEIHETNEPVIKSKAYDETPAKLCSTIDGRTAHLRGQTGMRPIESLTALAVLLHNRILTPKPQQRWMLGQLNIGRELVDADSANIKLNVDRIMGSTMTRTQIISGDVLIGTMLFILAKR